MYTIDLTKSVFELTKDPTVKQTLIDLGFKPIAIPPVRATVGRLMTVPKGCRLTGIPLENVVAALEKAGFTVES